MSYGHCPQTTNRYGQAHIRGRISAKNGVLLVFSFRDGSVSVYAMAPDYDGQIDGCLTQDPGNLASDVVCKANGATTRLDANGAGVRFLTC